MKKISKILLSLCAISLFCNIAYAQDDAFFHKHFEMEARDTDATSTSSVLSQSGLSFCGFYTNENGLNIGNFSDGENGFDFGNFSDIENGLNFGIFDYEEQTVSLNSGLFLLSLLAFVFWVRVSSKELRHHSI